MAKNNYFNEENVATMLMRYQQIVETEQDEKGHKIVINKTREIEQLENDITVEIAKIVKAIIFQYKYTMYLDYDQLYSAGLMACFTNYLKFTPESGSAFNFFSIITKKCLYGLTTRNSLKREKIVYIEDLGDAIHANSEPNIESFVDNLYDSLIDIINTNFVGKRRKKYKFISEVICDYIRKTKAYVSKVDMYRFAGSYGLRALDIREYIKEMKKYYSELASLARDESEKYTIETSTSQTHIED